jgi:hypothetical protein
MTKDNRRQVPPDMASTDEIDEVFGNANPNPERIGCPPRSALEQLARTRGSIDDPIYEHLGSCSPCYREWRAMQTAAGTSMRTAGATRRLRSMTWWMAAAAIVAALALVGVLWWLRKTPTPERDLRSVIRHDSSGETALSLDLRPYAVARGDSPNAVTRPPVLPRGPMRVTIILPVGAEAGPYDIQILDRNLRSRVTTKADAQLRDHITQLHTTLDLSALAEGTYQLALRREDEDWRFFPAEVKAVH